MHLCGDRWCATPDESPLGLPDTCSFAFTCSHATASLAWLGRCYAYALSNPQINIVPARQERLRRVNK